MSAHQLAEDFSALLTDLRRMQFDNEDPMRYAKRRAKEAALRVLEDAVSTARRVAELPGLIEMDYREAIKPND